MTEDNVIPFPQRADLTDEDRERIRRGVQAVAEQNLQWEDPAAAAIYFDRIKEGQSVEGLPEPRMVITEAER